MVTDDGPRVLEFNARFGDPETEVILPLLSEDLLPVLLACANGALPESRIIAPDGRHAACVMIVSGGYPGECRKGLPVTGRLTHLPEQTALFHAGTAREGNGRLVTAGGRVLAATAFGDATLAGAISRAYELVEGVTFDGKRYRTDIGAKAIG